LIVGVDGSERSRDALALAVQLAEPGQRVVLAHVHPYGQLSDLLSGGDYERLVREVAESTLSATPCTLASRSRASSSAGAFGYQSADDTLRRTLEQQMRDAIVSLGPGVDVSARLLDGDPSTALVGASKELDLLTLGSVAMGRSEPCCSAALAARSFARVRVASWSCLGAPARTAAMLRSDRGSRARVSIQVERGEHRASYAILVRKRRRLEVLGVGQRHFRHADALDRRIEVVEARLLDARGELGRNAVGRPSFFDANDPTGLRDGGGNGLDIQRA
jgi:hypothetical protein